MLVFSLVMCIGGECLAFVWNGGRTGGFGRVCVVVVGGGVDVGVGFADVDVAAACVDGDVDGDAAYPLQQRGSATQTRGPSRG